jgi:hypothetical protein
MSRKYIGEKLTYRIPEKNYLVFKEWCKTRGLDVSMGIRGAIGLLVQKGSVEEFLKDSEMKSLAVELLNKKGVVRE